MKAIFLIPGDLSVPGIGKTVKEGLENAGYTVEQHNPNSIQYHDLPKGDLIVCNGYRGRLPDIIKSYNERFNQDVILFDLGYINRRDKNKNPDGYYQVGLNKIGWHPQADLPSDRFDKLGKEVKPASKTGKYIVVAAQKFDDAQHKLNENQMYSWAKKSIDKISELSNSKIKFRPHPKSYFSIPNVQILDRGDSEDVVDKAEAVVTYNSTMGIEALLKGTPVFCDPCAHYAEFANTSLEKINDPYIPSVQERKKFFNRLAYAQWSVKEVEEGKPFKFLVDYINGKYEGKENADDQPEEYDQSVYRSEDQEQRSEFQSSTEREPETTEPSEYGSESPVEPDQRQVEPDQRQVEPDWRKENFFTQKAYVKKQTGETPKNKEELEEIAQRYGL